MTTNEPPYTGPYIINQAELPADPFMAALIDPKIVSSDPNVWSSSPNNGWGGHSMPDVHIGDRIAISTGDNPVPMLASIDPISLPVGPPDDTVLHCYGQLFTPDSEITFGGVSELTVLVTSNEVTTIITGGLFPNPDPAVPVTVVTPAPGGGTTATIDFAFT